MNDTGSPDVLMLQDIPSPTLQDEHDVLIRLYAAGINPVDTKLRSKGTYYPELSPHILGCDGAGIVESIGGRVNRFKAGDEVWFCYGGIGAHRATMLNMP